MIQSRNWHRRGGSVHGFAVGDRAFHPERGPERVDADEDEIAVHSLFDDAFPTLERSALDQDRLPFPNVLADLDLVVAREKFEVLNLMQIGEQFVFRIVDVQTNLRDAPLPARGAHTLQVERREDVPRKHRDRHRRALVGVFLPVLALERIDIGPIAARQVARDMVRLEKSFGV